MSIHLDINYSQSVMGFGRVQPGTDAGSDRQIGSFGRSVFSYLVPTIASVLDRSSQEAGRIGSGMSSFRSVGCFDEIKADRVTRCHRRSVH